MVQHPVPSSHGESGVGSAAPSGGGASVSLSISPALAAVEPTVPSELAITALTCVTLPPSPGLSRRIEMLTLTGLCWTAVTGSGAGAGADIGPLAVVSPAPVPVSAGGGAAEGSGGAGGSADGAAGGAEAASGAALGGSSAVAGWSVALAGDGSGSGLDPEGGGSVAGGTTGAGAAAVGASTDSSGSAGADGTGTVATTASAASTTACGSTTGSLPTSALASGAPRPAATRATVAVTRIRDDGIRRYDRLIHFHNLHRQLLSCIELNRCAFSRHFSLRLRRTCTMHRCVHRGDRAIRSHRFSGRRWRSRRRSRGDTLVASLTPESGPAHRLSRRWRSQGARGSDRGEPPARPLARLPVRRVTASRSTTSSRSGRSG